MIGLVWECIRKVQSSQSRVRNCWQDTCATCNRSSAAGGRVWHQGCTAQRRAVYGAMPTTNAFPFPHHHHHVRPPASQLVGRSCARRYGSLGSCGGRQPQHRDRSQCRSPRNDRHSRQHSDQIPALHNIGRSPISYNSKCPGCGSTLPVLPRQSVMLRSHPPISPGIRTTVAPSSLSILVFTSRACFSSLQTP